MAIEVSFCITCMGRLHHLRETLPQNLAHNENVATEFVLLDYASSDGLGEWVQNCMVGEMQAGRLSYFRLTGRQNFDRSHAKNVAHRVARGTIVCNLDADNFTGVGFALYLADTLREKNCFVRADEVDKETFGRIAFQKQDFERLGGYDERMKAWGYEDSDICERAKAIGLREVRIPAQSSFLSALRHSSEERTEFHDIKDRFASNSLHEALSRESIGNAEYVANRGLHWGQASLIRNFYERIEI